MSNPNIPTPHITAKEGDFARTVLMPGDPLRSKFIAETYLENPVLVNDTRGVLSGYEDGVHHPQPAVSGRVPDQGGSGYARSGRRSVHLGQAGVLRLRELHEGRPRLRGRADHRFPELCGRDPDRVLRRASGRPPARAQGSARGHPQRHRRERLRPGEGPADLRELRSVSPRRQGDLQGGAAKGARPDG